MNNIFFFERFPQEFVSQNPSSVIYIDYYSTKKAISEHQPVILTTSVSLMSFGLTEYNGYKIFLVNEDFKCVEIKPNMPECEREIRYTHNIYKIFRAGGFDHCFTEETPDFKEFLNPMLLETTSLPASTSSLKSQDLIQIMVEISMDDDYCSDFSVTEDQYEKLKEIIDDINENISYGEASINKCVDNYPYEIDIEKEAQAIVSECYKQGEKNNVLQKREISVLYFETEKFFYSFYIIIQDKLEDRTKPKKIRQPFIKNKSDDSYPPYSVSREIAHRVNALLAENQENL